MSPAPNAHRSGDAWPGETRGAAFVSVNFDHVELVRGHEPAPRPEADSRWADAYRANREVDQPLATLADQLAARVCRALGI
ncbi:hypothetical protein [Saccharopolyspora phatthalungensis]|uniref:Uncharacterized protein n=1 Tax=Saccharopolyspora phatthalungensis TaxID=664693 RepID=A0A840Q0J5_9PSEU|nr:hypothetical protein [Saccharopolyspora phatthalungensis]MBB5156052.1 hypothetical protein [Saccharopolyspora phatthalungensis]